MNLNHIYVLKEEEIGTSLKLYASLIHSQASNKGIIVVRTMMPITTLFDKAEFVVEEWTHKVLKHSILETGIPIPIEYLEELETRYDVNAVNVFGLSEQACKIIFDSIYIDCRVKLRKVEELGFTETDLQYGQWPVFNDITPYTAYHSIKQIQKLNFELKTIMQTADSSIPTISDHILKIACQLDVTRRNYCFGELRKAEASAEEFTRIYDDIEGLREDVNKLREQLQPEERQPSLEELRARFMRSEMDGLKPGKI